MGFEHDDTVREQILLKDETVLRLLRPGKKAFFFYRVRLPAIFLFAVLAILLAANICFSSVKKLPLSGMALYAAGAALIIVITLADRLIQKRFFSNRAYYITDRRILIVSGFRCLKYQTLNYRFIGSAILKRTPCSKLFGMDSYSINLIMNINKRLTVKFFSISGTSLSYLEDPGDAYRHIAELSGEK